MGWRPCQHTSLFGWERKAEGKNKGREMDLESVKRLLENGEGTVNESSIKSPPTTSFDPFILQGVHVDLVEPGRLVCSMKVPPRLLVKFRFIFPSRSQQISTFLMITENWALLI